VVDQHKPWFTPSRTFAATTHDQEGAQMISTGTGSPASQPATSTTLRPTRSLRPPAARLASALVRPKLTMNDRMALFEASEKSCSARTGKMERSSPTMPPTKALTTTSSVNCRQLARNPSRGGSQHTDMLV
jgi:hypothetical protein